MERNRKIYQVTLVGGVVNVVLLLFKFVAGIVGHSAAMVADAVHSLSDFVTDVIVLVFVRISGKPQDKSHDYGHGKYETLAMTLIGIALLVVAVGILYSGATKIYAWTKGEQLEAPGVLALWAALLSVLLKEGVYQYSMVNAKKLNSQVLAANAWHHRSEVVIVWVEIQHLRLHRSSVVLSCLGILVTVGRHLDLHAGVSLQRLSRSRSVSGIVGNLRIALAHHHYLPFSLVGLVIRANYVEIAFLAEVYNGTSLYYLDVGQGKCT